MAELPHGGVDLLGPLEIAHVARPLDHDEFCVRDGFLELAGDGQRLAGIRVPPKQQGGDGDLSQQLAQIGFGHDVQLHPQGGWADVDGHGGEQQR